jgi:hypothetical protein
MSLFEEDQLALAIDDASASRRQDIFFDLTLDRPTAEFLIKGFDKLLKGVPTSEIDETRCLSSISSTLKTWLKSASSPEATELV